MILRSVTQLIIIRSYVYMLTGRQNEQLKFYCYQLTILTYIIPLFGVPLVRQYLARYNNIIAVILISSMSYITLTLGIIYNFCFKIQNITAKINSKF